MIVVVVDFVLFFVVKTTVFVYSASLSEHDTQWDETVGNRRIQFIVKNLFAISSGVSE